LVARDDPAAADRFVTRIVEAIETLCDHPHLGRPGRVAGTRELVIADTPYIVPYRVVDDGVEILAVIHGARRWPDRLDQTGRRSGGLSTPVARSGS
jgi:plasmid stabilization system protein ParE